MADSKMQLFIKTEDSIIELLVQPSTSLYEVLEMIQPKVNIPWEEQQLTLGSRKLKRKIGRFTILLSFSMNMQTIQVGKAKLQVVHTSLLL